MGLKCGAPVGCAELCRGGLRLHTEHVVEVLGGRLHVDHVGMQVKESIPPAVPEEATGMREEQWEESQATAPVRLSVQVSHAVDNQLNMIVLFVIHLK